MLTGTQGRDAWHLCTRSVMASGSLVHHLQTLAVARHLYILELFGAENAYNRLVLGSQAKLAGGGTQTMHQP